MPYNTPTEDDVTGMDAKSTMTHTKHRAVCLLKRCVDYSRLSELPKYFSNEANNHSPQEVYAYTNIYSNNSWQYDYIFIHFMFKFCIL